ncbi:hypothetical protein H2200_009976 [Cladophialophora chaetospira]|uniref:Cytochrome P450 n=1 Tax=Cladophialophora chaetospira TaxID=386627 RepID=A0AA38X207_9EURO|nr:hypothetical protein H2200_009976 [Cladophialophora chaetospira]
MHLLSLVVLGQALIITTLVLRAIYRLTLHPLSRFPGPRLAATTNLYAVYYDLISSDSLVKHLKALHDKYGKWQTQLQKTHLIEKGPVVRVRPNELHIFDWEAYRTVFKAGSDFDRAPEFYNAPQVEGSILNIPDGRVAKPHRELFVQAFSKVQINGLEPLIHDKISLFLRRLKEEAALNKSIDLDFALNCLTADVTMNYCYQMSLGLLNTPGFRPSLVVGIHEMGPMVPFFWYFPTIGKVMNKVIFSLLPENVVKTYVPPAAALKDIVNRCGELIESLARAPPDSKKVTTSIFRTALNPNREKGQYIASQKELAADAVLMFLAGTDTTAHALMFGIWEMMKRRELWIRLRDEVASAFSETRRLALIKDLETLPFLRAVVKESLRISLGTSARLHRVVPRQGAVLCGEVIAPGTRVSFSHYVYNNDPAIFLDPYSFKPERWLEADADELEKHMVSFSRGSRNCMGMNLAYAELYTTFAHLAHTFDILNDGTTDEMMDWTDAFTPRLKGHLKVILRPR